MGPTYVRAQVPALLALWKNFFPHSMKQLKEEQSKESLNSLTFLLEQRTGVLSGTTCAKVAGLVGWFGERGDGEDGEGEGDGEDGEE